MVLSVIIPYYNSNNWISKTLDSLLAQNMSSSEYEIIVVDDDSDEVPLLLNDYTAKYPCIHYFNQGKLGMSGARNFGLSIAKGDWVFFCDSDDFLQSQVLRGIIDAAERHKLDIIFANSIELKPEQKPVSPRRNFSSITDVKSGMDYYAEPSNPLAFAVWNYLVRRSVLTTNNLHFMDVYCAEERNFYQDLMPCVKRAAHIDVDMYYYVRHEDSVSHGKKRKKCSEYMSNIYGFILRLSKEIKDNRYDSAVIQRMKFYMGRNAFIILHNVFRYCPVRETIDYLSCLSELEAYPITHYAGKSAVTRLTLKYMNKKHLWLFFCRLYHILPAGIRMRI